jgi:sarcosine oxidase subunit beta
LNSPDVVVIGGGIIGACAAYNLAQSGLKTLILEQGDPVSGASGANLGQISIIDRHEPWHLRLALDSLEIYRQIQDEADIQYQESGGSIVLMNPEQLEAARSYQALFKSMGVSVEIADDSRIAKWEPHFEMGSALAMAHCPLEGKFNPLYTALYFHKKAREAGAELLAHTPVTGFKKEGKRIKAVLCPGMEFKPRWVLNAAGSWAPAVGAMAGLNIPLGFHRGAAMVSETLPHLVNGPIVGGGFLLPPGTNTAERYIAFGLTQSADGSLIIGQANDMNVPLGSSDVSLYGLKGMAARFLQHFPSLKHANIIRSWAAVTPYCPDGLPVYGFSREAENFFTAAGFKGAFSTAPALARRLPADLAGAQPDADWAQFSPDRSISKEKGESN